MNRTQKAWMAGIIETRGKIHFTNDPSRRTNQLVLRIATARTNLASRLAALTGVKTHLNQARTITADRRACVEHCDDAHVHVVAEIPEVAVWAISGAAAAIVLDNLRPYFIDDTGIQAVVDNILSALPTAGQGRAAVDASIIRLRRLGWSIPPAALEHFVGLPQKRSERGRFARHEPDRNSPTTVTHSVSVGPVTDG